MHDVNILSDSSDLHYLFIKWCIVSMSPYVGSWKVSPSKEALIGSGESSYATVIQVEAETRPHNDLLNFIGMVA